MNELEKIVYDIICSDNRPPSEDEHWEGYTAKRIVAALKPLIAAAERKDCAEIAEYWCCNGMPRTTLADQIRARGQHD
jgi:phage gp36-like protein